MDKIEVDLKTLDTLIARLEQLYHPKTTMDKVKEIRDALNQSTDDYVFGLEEANTGLYRIMYRKNRLFSSTLAYLKHVKETCESTDSSLANEITNK